MASYIIPPYDSFFLFIGIINVIYMSLDFHTKIQNLTNKLQSLSSPPKKEIDIQDVKSSLKKMLDEIGKELLRTNKRVEKIEARLVKKLRTHRRQEIKIKDIWSQQQEKVQQTICKWVEEYEQKAEQALTILQREQRSYNLKLQQEQETLTKQLRIQQNKSKDLLHILQRQINKLNTINNQNISSINQQINLTKRTISNSTNKTQQLFQEKVNEIQRRIIRIRQNLSARSSIIKQEISNKNAKFQKIISLILQIV